MDSNLRQGASVKIDSVRNVVRTGLSHWRRARSALAPILVAAFASQHFETHHKASAQTSTRADCWFPSTHRARMADRHPARVFISLAWAFIFVLGIGAAHAESVLRVERIEVSAENPSADALTALADARFELPAVNPLRMQVKRGEPRLWRVRVLALEQDPSQLLLSINNSFDSDIRFYFPPRYLAQTYNIFRSTTPSEHSRFAMAVSIPANMKPGDTFFVEAPNPKAVSLEMRIRDRVSYARNDLNIVRIHSAVISVMLSCCAVSICFFFVLRERVWLLFVCYAIAGAGQVLSRTGELIAITGALSLDDFAWQAATIFALLQVSALCFFLCEFAKLKEMTPRADRALRIFGWTMLTLACFSVFPVVAKSHWLPGTANVLLLISMPVSVLACLSSARQGVRAAWFYLFAFLPMIAAYALIFAHLQGLFAGGTWVTVVFLASHAFASIMLTVGMADQVLNYRKQRDLAIDDANHDPLAGAWNRRAFDQRLDRLLRRMNMARESLTLCFLDLDYFKRVNDQFGHVVGDEALRFLVAEASQELRNADFIARLGGEEFVVVLPDTYLRDGLMIAERIRQRVETHGKQISGHPLNLTVSIGVIATNAKLKLPQTLTAAADEALYRAKSMGRNRVATSDLPTLIHKPSQATS